MAKKKSQQTYETMDVKDVKSGMVIRVHQTIKDVNAKGEEKERVQVFEGLVIRRRGGNEPGATMTVRKTSGGIGVEKIFPIALPAIKKIELVKHYKVRRANLGFLRTQKKRLKEITKKA